MFTCQKCKMGDCAELTFGKCILCWQMQHEQEKQRADKAEAKNELLDAALEHLAGQFEICPWDKLKWTPEGGCGDNNCECEVTGVDVCWKEWAKAKAST